jgi:hypothetical protein
MRSFVVLPLVFMALPLVACGGATADTPDGGDAGHGSTTDGSMLGDNAADHGDAGHASNTDGSMLGDEVADTDGSMLGDEAADYGDGGTILLQAFGGADGEVAAQIPLLEPGVGQERTCAAPMNAGACQLTSCKLGGIGSPVPGYGDFGPISASVGTTAVIIDYNGFGYPTTYFPSSVTLAPGGTMTFRGGNGAQVPKFDVSATVPGVGVITSPVPTTDGGAAIIDTSQDLTVTWLPIPIGQIKFGLDGGAVSVGGTAVSVACTFDGATGSGVVAQALLSSLKGMSGANPTYGILSSELDATTVVDGLTIVTQSFQNTPPSDRGFNVTLE